MVGKSKFLSFTDGMIANAMVDVVLQDAIDYGGDQRDGHMAVVVVKTAKPR